MRSWAWGLVESSQELCPTWAKGPQAKASQSGDPFGRESPRVQTLELGVCTLSDRPFSRLVKSGEPYSE